MADLELDTKGLKCPMPIIKIAKIFKTLHINQTLEVQATDPVFLADVKAWCKKTSNELISKSEQDGVFIAVIKKLN